MNSKDDWYDASRVGENCICITEAGKYGMYLLEGEDRALLIDTGVGIGDLGGFVESLTEKPITVLLTHTHWDHIGGASQFDDVRVSETELPEDGVVRIDSLSSEFTHRPREFADRWLAEGNAFPDEFDPETYSFDPAPATAVTPDTTIDLGGRAVEVRATPGHSPGHVVVLDRESETVYGGDIIHGGKGLYVQFEDSDINQYLESMKRLCSWHQSGEFSKLATSHNEPLVDDDLSHLQVLAAALEDIVNDEMAFETIETSWGTARQYPVGDTYILTP